MPLEYNPGPAGARWVKNYNQYMHCVLTVQEQDDAVYSDLLTEHKVCEGST